MSDINEQLVLVGGLSASGKSASLRNIRNQNKWLYLNTEAGKRLPFRNQFQTFLIEDPWQVHEAFDHAKETKDVEGIVVDSATFLMDMFESQYVLNAVNTQKAWQDFAQFFKVLMQSKVTALGKPAIFMAHVREEYDETAMAMKTSVPIKGSLKNNGIEAYFSTVVASKRITIKDLAPFKSALLNITLEEEALGFKHVFQTRLTKGTIHERIRSPMGMFSPDETYMDNDVQVLLDHLKSFYN